MELKKSLTFDDILLEPKFSEINPNDVSVDTSIAEKINIKIPLLASAMDTVSEFQLAIAMAQSGGIACIHKNMSIENQVAQIRSVKRFESGLVTDPITISPESTLEDAKNLMNKNKISGIIVVDREKKVIGILTNRDVRFVGNKKTQVKDLMTKKLITADVGISLNDAKKILSRNKIEKLIILDKLKRCKGLITVKDIEKSSIYPNAAKDIKGSLLVGAAVGVGDQDFIRAEKLFDAGVDIIFIDTAHGHSKRVLDMVKKIKKKINLPLVAGNIATSDAAKALIDCGADCIKVGIGPGSICTTRVVAGVGVPQFSAILNIFKSIKTKKIKIIADGGIRYSGDITKALAAGADGVMIGSLFAGTEESPGEVFYFQGRSYKSYRGMGSMGAMSRGSADRYFQEEINDNLKLVPEGIEGRVPYKGPIRNVIHQLIGGLKAGMGYVGAKSISELKTKASFIEISNSGVKEGHVHDIQITKQSPNYPFENI